MRCAASALALLALASCGKTGEEYVENVVDAQERGKALGARGDLQTLAVAITGYVTAEGELPDAADIGELAALLEPNHARRVPRKDPWGGGYDYWTDGDSYVLSSAGKDGEWDTDDDLEVSDGQLTKMPAGRF